MKIAITGSKGQLGLQFMSCSENYSYNFIFFDKYEFDISNQDISESIFQKHKFDLLINCAAYTKVDEAENNYEAANLINNISVLNIAKLCEKYDVKLVHISTDYVFDGKSNIPYNENHKTNPLTNYGITKRNGEISLINSSFKDFVVIRTSWLYSKFGENFYTKILKGAKSKNTFKIIDDQFGSPTNATDLVEFILDNILKLFKKKSNLYHFSNNGICSWYEFASEIKTICKLDIKIIPIKTEEFYSKVKRPLYSVLDCSKAINDFNLDLIDWKTSLKKNK